MPYPISAYTVGDCCIKANRCVAFGIRIRSHTEVCSLQTSPSAPCASSFLRSQDNLASKIMRLLTFATVSVGSICPILYLVCLFRLYRTWRRLMTVAALAVVQFLSAFTQRDYCTRVPSYALHPHLSPCASTLAAVRSTT